MQQPSVLRELLAAFLSGNENIHYPQLECSVLQLNPLSITDNGLHYIDLLSHAEVIATKLRHSRGNSFKLVLKKWNFVFRQIPGTTEDYYFDIEIKDFEIRENFYMLQLNQQPIKLIDDQELSYLFEERRRKEIEKDFLGMNDNQFRFKSGKSSLAKSELSSFSRGTGFNPTLPFNPAFGGTFTPTYKVEKRVAPPGKGSIKSTTYHDSRKTKPIISEPFFKDSGVQRPHRIIKPTTGKIPFDEIYDTDLFIPVVDELTILRYIPEWRINRVKPVKASEVENFIASKNSTPSFKKPTNKSSRGSPTKRSGKHSAKTKITGFSVDTIQAGVDSGLIDWD